MSMVKIKIAKAIQFNDKLSAFIKMPYDDLLVGMIRKQPARYYHKDRVLWEIPIVQLDSFIKNLDEEDIEYKIVNPSKLPRIKDVRVPKGFEYKTKPFKHQREGLRMGLFKDNWVLGDEQGLGKTKQVIDIGVALKLKHGYKHALIICGVNGLKWNWQNEINIHSDEKAHVIGSRIKGIKLVADSVKKRIEDLNSDLDAYFLIINIESLRNVEIVDRLKEMIADGQIGFIAVDEVHKTKNPNSSQGKGLLKLQAQNMVAMTGTPLVNRPLDLYLIARWLGFEQRSFSAYKNYYCTFNGYRIIGYKHMDEPKTLLSNIMLRRKKEDALDLPDKIHTLDYVEMGTKQGKVYYAVVEQLKSEVEKIILNPNPLSQTMRLRQATAAPEILTDGVKESAKMNRMLELMDEIVQNGDKAIVFSNWSTVTQIARKRLEKDGYGVAYVTGEVSTDERQIQMANFQQDPNVQVIVGTIGAMGTGLTLTAASNVIFLDEPWTMAEKQQAEDRAHRIGTKKAVNVITLITKNTVDEYVHDIVNTKGQMAEVIVDGKVRGQYEDRADVLRMLGITNVEAYINETE